MQQWMSRHRKVIWYTMCFALLGLIDQRCGSAVGEVQMIFRNGTGIVVALMLFPSLELSEFKKKVYLMWTPICLVLTAVACVVGMTYWTYPGQWISGVWNLTVWSYLLIYIFKNRKTPGVMKHVKNPLYICIFLLFLLMQLSVHEGVTPLWYMLIFGGFYIVGMTEEDQEYFLQGLLNGVIVCFFVQQIIAFGFRPYDYVRYRGLYSGETQNGLFYLLAYCAFLLKWWLAKEKGARWLWRWGYFILSAGCVGFTVLTGGRSPFVAEVIVTLFLYTKYYIFKKKSFYRWLVRSLVLVLIAVIMFPVVYGCVRYLPTILHHPIWFEGEYDANTSVHSYDSWDSERYISIEKVIDLNAGRILELLGIDVQGGQVSAVGALKAYAAEATELSKPGATPENPYVVEPNWTQEILGIRANIYDYYWNQLNLYGHTSEEAGVYLSKWYYAYHAHNMFLQIAYDYGMISGMIFVGVSLYSIFYYVRQHREHDIICAVFLLAIVCFGMLEMAVEAGQFVWTLYWLLLGLRQRVLNMEESVV